MFIMLTGSSGVGKNTLINELRKTHKKVALMPTLTTRNMRPGEVEGDPFYYLTVDGFMEKINNNELFEYELIHGNYYGSSKIIFEEYLKNGSILMKDIGVEGAINLGKILKEHTNVVKVFLTTKTKRVLIKRLKERGEKEIKKRLKRYPYEQAQKNKFDFIILNKTKEQTVKDLKEIIENENDNKNVLFTKPFNKLNINKIEKLIKKYEIKPSNIIVRVCLKDGKIIIKNKNEKAVAAIILNLPITKKIVNNCKNKQDELEQIHYKTYISARKNNNKKPL